MKTSKPFRLSLLVRPYRWQRRDHLGISVLALSSLGDDSRLMPEQELWQMAAEELDPGAVLDLGVPKHVPEILANGYGYTRHQTEKSACAVRIRVAELEKALTVFGDRYLLGGRSTAPQPFEQMRVDWGHAYGGPGVAENPLGIGTLDEVVNGVATRRVPNVELPGRGGRAEPAGFGALLPDWPQRMSLMGRNHGKDWVENDFPGFAGDMDWRYFNAAPPDQHFQGRQELPPGADYEIWNMHPSQPVLRGRLPGWKARCFISFRKDGGELVEAAPLRLTTAWFFPHRERVALIWQGACPVIEDDAADVKHIMPALEMHDAPRALAHYQSVLLRRLDTEHGVVHVMRDRDLVPQEALGAFAAMELPDVLAEPLPRNMRAGQQRDYEARRKDLIAQGTDPDKYLAPPPPVERPPTIDELPDLYERMEKEAAQTREEIEARHGMSGLAKPKGEGSPQYPAASEELARRLDPDELIRELTRIDEGAPAELIASARAAGGWKEAAAARIRQGYAHAAHLSAPAPALSSYRAAKIRRQLEAVPVDRRDFAGMNLIRADLSGMDLRGANFSDAMLEDADLSGALLDECDFSRAVLARATLKASSLKRARFVQANLGKAQFEGADISGGSLREARCYQTRFHACNLSGVDFAQVEFHESTVNQCDLSTSRWRQSSLHKMTLRDVLFDGADFDQIMWVECGLVAVSFDKALLKRCGFLSTDGSQGVRFSGATLEACSFAHGTTFADAAFDQAMLKHCGVRGATLRRADFSGARFEGSDFSECDFREARLDRVAAGESLFVRADLSGASVRDANLIDANFSKAILSATDLRGANLFRTDVSQALIDGTTRMEDAYTHGAKIWPVRRTDPAA